MLEQKRKEITPDVIKSFLEGNDPMERIVNIDYSYRDDFVSIYYRDEQDRKCLTRDYFYPFVWATREACLKLCRGDREMVKKLRDKYSISIRALDTRNADGVPCEDLCDGYLFLFQAKRPMSYSNFLQFFKDCGNPIYKDRKKDENGNEIREKSGSRDYLCVTPVEQYMIYTGKRFFKGYDDYDETLRMIFDLETGEKDENGNKVSGLDPHRARIQQFGIRFNRPVQFNGKMVDFEKIFTVTGDTKEEKDANELQTIRKALSVIYTFNPDIITAHNGENFDWWFIIERCKELGTTLEELSKPYFDGVPIRKSQRENVLKLGGEVETYFPTQVPGRIVTDSLHAVRRAQAIDSNMLKANLKYVTKYSKMEKKNRVYLPGDEIGETWAITDNAFAFNDNDGDWYRVDEGHPCKPGYSMVSGRYIAERYLLDDLWECDKVEHRYNTSNFLICKMLPVPFQKCCIMGTAGQWKSIMLAWSYENGLAVPAFGEKKKFTGGLSRLLRVGYIPNVIKLDYNSLYPSIIITWAIANDKDITKVMLYLLEHVLTEREKYKGLKKEAGKKAGALEDLLKSFSGSDAERESMTDEMKKYQEAESANDKKQLPMKIFGNSYFGSFGAPQVFPWASTECAEQTTCTGRQSLRLMISHFTRLGYQPIVGDSFTGDTPLFIKYTEGDNKGLIDIKPISEIIDENHIKKDALGREYDYSRKPYNVLCRSGWHNVDYVYRHGTEKPIYKVEDGDMSIEVTEDHSLFDSEKKRITPSEIKKNTKLEYFKGSVSGKHNTEVSSFDLALMVVKMADGDLDRVPVEVLNSGKSQKKWFYDNFIERCDENKPLSKTALAGLQYLKNTSV